MIQFLSFVELLRAGFESVLSEARVRVLRRGGVIAPLLILILALGWAGIFAPVSAESELIRAGKTITPDPEKINTWKIELDLEVLAPAGRNDTLIVLDRSVSSDSDFAAYKAAVVSLVETILKPGNEQTRVGLIGFDDDAVVLHDLAGADQLDSVRAAVQALTASASQNAQAGLHQARKILGESPAARKNVILFLNQKPGASFAINNPEEYSLNLGKELITNSIIPEFAFNYDLIIRDGQVYPGTAPAVTSNAVNSLIAESIILRTEGINLFTVSIDGALEVKDLILTTDAALATNAASDNLSESIVDIAIGALGFPGQIRYSEKIAMGFEIPDELIDTISVSSGTISYNKKLDEFIWTLDPIWEPGVQRLSYTIRPNQNILQIFNLAAKTYPTVESGVLSYRVSDLGPIAFEVEARSVAPIFVRIDNHLLDGLNQIVNEPNRKFTIEFASETEKYTYQIGAYETKIILDLDQPGTYTVSETATNQGSMDDYNVSISPAAFTVEPESGPITLTVINRINPGGKLTIRQEIVDPYGNVITDDERAAAYLVEGPNGFRTEVTVSPKEPATLSDLVYGDYRIVQAKLSDRFENVAAPADNTVTVSESEKFGEALFVNRFTPAQTDIVGRFDWVDGPKSRPSIYVNLYQSDTPVFDEPTVVEKGAAEYVWKNVNATDMHGKAFDFRIELAEPVPDYETNYPDSLTIRNQYVISNNGTATATVEWYDGPAIHPAVALQLVRRVGKGEAEAVPNADPLLVSPDSNETQWRDLDLTTISGEPYSFSVRQGVLEDGVFTETQLNSYDTEIDGLTVRNQFVVRSDGVVTAEIDWVNGDATDRPTVYLRLYRQLSESSEAGLVPGARTLEVANGAESVSWPGLELTTMTGEPYRFTVRQVNRLGEDYTPPSYMKMEDGLTVTNTYVVPEQGSAAASVRWVDGPDQKPDISLQLVRSVEGGETEVVPGQIMADLSGGVSGGEWVGLEETDLAGKPYAFSVRVGRNENGTFVEREPESYSVSVNGMNVVNTFKVPLDGSAKAVVDWINGPENNRPTVYLQLLRTTVDGETEIVPNLAPIAIENGETTAAWENLERTDPSGRPFAFSVRQVSLNGAPFSPENYVAEEDGLTITNSYVIPSDGEIFAQVIWQNGPSDDRPVVWLKPLRAILGMPPEEIPGTEIIRLEAGTTSADWSGLDRTDLAGNEYMFSVVQGRLDDGRFINENPPSYEKNETGTVVTNRYVIPTDGSATATVRWENGPADQRPEVYVKLYRSAGKVGPTPVPDAEVKPLENGKSTVSWNDLESTDPNGVPYVFSAVEVNAEGEAAAPDNYTAMENGLTIVNRYVIPTDGTVEAKIEWINGSAVQRPSFLLALVRSIDDGEPELVPNAPRQLVESDTDTVSWSGLARGDINGNPYKFSLRVVSQLGTDSTIPNYSSVVDGLILRNVYIVPTDATATATVDWIGGPEENRPPVWLRLYRRSDPDAIPESVPNAQILALPAGQDSVTWQGLDATDLDGRPYEFNVHLVNGSGEFFFLANYEKKEEGLKITNRFIIPTYASATATVTWVDGDAANRPDTWVRLTRGLPGEPMTFVPDLEPVLLSHGTATATWDNLEVTDSKGNNYVFGAVQTDENGQSAEPRDYRKSEDGMSIVNTYQVPFDYTAEGRVVWEGGSVIRPTVYLKLFRKLGEDGAVEPVQDATVKTLVNGVTLVLWNDLQRTDINGKPFFYSVQQVDESGAELVLDRYTTTTNGTTVTNTFIVPKTGSARGMIQWVDGPKNDRPTVRLKLMRQINNGPAEAVPDTEIKTLPNGTTSVEWHDLAETDIYGNDYLFTVRLVDENGEETTIPGYILKLKGTVAVNTYIIPTGAVVEGTKVWVGGPKHDRPTTWFRVYRRVGDGAEILIPGSRIVELPNGVTTARWEDLESTDANGFAYTFSVREVDSSGSNSVLENYVKSEDGLTVTNTYVIPTNGKADATIEWINAPDTVPAVWFKLFRTIEGGETEEVPDAILKQLNGSINSVSWTNLESTDGDGNAYIFSVREVNAYGFDFVPEGFEKVETGLRVINTYLK